MVYISEFLYYIRQGDTRLNQKLIKCNVGNSKLSHRAIRLYYNS